MSTDVYRQMAINIIREQEIIIGPIAVEQAGRVNGLTVNWKHHDVSFTGNEIKIVENLIEKYRDFFGQVSVEVCKNAVKNLLSDLPAKERPALLR
ncbi:MAG: hypothetical protein WC489_03775 [Patescibacteria group bacterium]